MRVHHLQKLAEMDLLGSLPKSADKLGRPAYGWLFQQRKGRKSHCAVEATNVPTDIFPKLDEGTMPVPTDTRGQKVLVG
jgi:hypothetical protein